MIEMPTEMEKMSTYELRDILESHREAFNVEGCYSSKDIRALERIREELSNREDE